MVDLPATRTFIREDELLALGSDAWVEVVDGEVVEMSPNGVLHHFVGGNVYSCLGQYAIAHKIGFVFMTGLMFYLKRDGDRLYQARVPDVWFVHKDSIPSDWNLEKPFPGAPTLAVEVMSPDDKLEDVVKKVGEYFDAGTVQSWVMLPRQKEVYQYVRGKSKVRIYSGDDEMDVEALFPGLKLSLKDIFALPEFEQEN
jgi:Uma2 family endonuclease